MGINLLNGIVYNSGATKINNALQLVADGLGNGNLSFRSGKKTVAVVMTDGRSDDGVNPGANNLRAAKGAGESDVKIISLAIGGNIDQGELDSMATDPDSVNSLNVSGYGNLQDVKDALGQAVCN